MKKQNNAIVVTSIIAGVVLIIALVALSIFSNAVPNSKNSVTVQGTSSVKANPDLVSVYFNVEANGTTASEAKTGVDNIYNSLHDTLIALGFSESEIQTQNYNVYPNSYWDSTTQRQKTDGYKATQTVTLEFPTNETGKLSSVIDAGVNSGAGISYINFELSPELQNQYKAQALEAASKDARTKAESVASGFNKNVGKLLLVQVDNYYYYPVNVYTAKASGATAEDVSSAQQAVSNITPSEQDVTATVSATFRLN